MSPTTVPVDPEGGEGTLREHKCGCARPVGLLKYVDLLLARFNLGLAQAHAGNGEWQDTINDSEREAEFEAWLAKQLASA